MLTLRTVFYVFLLMPVALLALATFEAVPHPQVDLQGTTVVVTFWCIVSVAHLLLIYCLYKIDRKSKDWNLAGLSRESWLALLVLAYIFPAFIAYIAP
jgi:hypothetical protein